MRILCELFKFYSKTKIYLGYGWPFNFFRKHFKKVFYVESPIEHGVLKQMGKKM